MKLIDKIKQNGEKDSLLPFGTFIVKARGVIFVLFAVFAVYCAANLGRVRINSDLTSFLPDTTETRRGIAVMNEEFVTYGTEDVMVSNITYDTALELCDKLKNVSGVYSVTFDETEAHYKNASALFGISFEKEANDGATKAAQAEIESILSEYDSYTSKNNIVGDYADKLAQEMLVVILLAAAVIIAVLLFTSHSYFEVVIYVIVFVFAALFNMGTNFWLGEISSITNSIAVILQLALAIDYSIIFAHRYQDEAAHIDDEKQAMASALAKSIKEIFSSSLTTISGLAALTLMQFRLGRDLGIVLSKGIVCSMLTVFLLMPGLILLFPKALKKTEHKQLVPNVEGWGGLLMKKVPVFLIVFAVILPFAVIFSGKTEYAFSDSSVTELIYSPEREAMHKINDTFEPNTAVAVIVPAGNYDSEKQILERLSALDGVKSATGLASVSTGDGRVLTDKYTPRMFSELAGVDIETARFLYRAYGIQNEKYGIAISPEDAGVPLIDMMVYITEKLDQGVSLGNDTEELFDNMKSMLKRGIAQLHGENYDRLVLSVSLPAEGEESELLVKNIRRIASEYYGDENVLVTGDITSARDLRQSYKSDSILISLLTIVFVYIILLFTFRSPVTAAVLVFVIQGSIWINFSVPYLTGVNCSFVTNMIVSAIQMGATIDYAIVIMSHYQSNRQLYDKRTAMVKAVNESFPTVLTSGSIMTAAGFLIAYRVSDVYVGHIGLCVGRGALISVILVLTVLPQLIVLFDGVIRKTTWRSLTEKRGVQ